MLYQNNKIETKKRRKKNKSAKPYSLSTMQKRKKYFIKFKNNFNGRQSASDHDVKSNALAMYPLKILAR